MLLGIAATVTNLAVTGVPETSAKVVQLLTCCYQRQEQPYYSRAASLLAR